MTGARNLLLPSGPSIQRISVERDSPKEPPLNPRLLRSAHRPSNPDGSRIHSAIRIPRGASLEKSTYRGTKLRQNSSASKPASSALNLPALVDSPMPGLAAAGVPMLLEVATVSTRVLTSLTCW